jgi:hypothetical protein
MTSKLNESGFKRLIDTVNDAPTEIEVIFPSSNGMSRPVEEMEISP